jgi:heptosyltransferase-1
LFVRILIIKPSSLGDIIHTFPAVYALQQSQPDLHLSWVVNNNFAGIVSLLPGIDRVIPFPRQQIARLDWSAWKQFKAMLQAEHYDLAIDFQGLFRSGMIAWLSKADRRVGFAHAREGAPLFYQQKITVPSNIRHAVDKNRFLVQDLFKLPEDFAPEPVLQVKPEWLEAAGQLLQAEVRPVLAVGFSSRWQSKTWPAAFFAEVLQEVIRRVPSVQCWLLGSKSEHAEGEKLCQSLNSAQVINLAGQTSMETLVGLLKSSHALLTNDSGPMHIAAALQTPCIALFGATDPQLTGPYGGSRNQVFRTLCPKSPCFKRKCPIGDDQCPKEIPPADVAEAISSRLKNRTHLQV